MMNSPNSRHKVFSKISGLIAVVCVGLVLDWLCLEGYRAAFYTLGFGVALLVTANIFFLAILIWLSDHPLHRSAETFSYSPSTIKQADLRSAAFSKLGQRLSETTTEKDAVKIILNVADELLGWDASSFDMYSPEQDAVFNVLAMDLVEGRRSEVAPAYMSRSPSLMIRSVIDEGPQLILRDAQTLLSAKLIAFGDKGRPSASLMFVAVRHFGHVTGILSIQSYQPNAYTREDLETLQALADHCGGAMERIQAEQRCRSIFDNAVTGLFQSSPNGRFITANAPFARKLGYASPKELIASINDIARQLFVAPERYELFQRLLDEAGVARSFQAQLQRKDGGRIWVSINARAVKNERGEIFYYEGSVEDISERKKTEREILLLAQAMRSTNDCVCITDLEDKILFANESFLRTYGYESDELLGQNIEIVRSPNTPPDVAKQILPATLAGGWQGELLNRKKNGEEFPVSLSSGLIRDEQDKPIALIGVAADISERKRTENILAKERNLLRTLVDNLPVAVFIKDLQGRFLLNNPKHLQILGAKSAAEAEGKTAFDFFPEESAKTFVAADQQLLQTGQIYAREESVTDAAGQPHWYAGIKAPLHDAQGKIVGIIGINQEITERINLEAQLRQSQKMESIGQLAGGIAHDFNNILTIIQGHAALLQGSENLPRGADEAIAQISHAAERAASLTSRLLMFSRRQVMQPKDLDLNDVVSSLAKMLERILREDISLQVSYSPLLPLIRADRGMFEQVLLNLAVNARDAMPHGGKLMIRTFVQKIKSSDLTQNSEARAGQFVGLEVSDTGEGIALENQPRIFEPFFTTKDVGKGTGLGLATVYGIVKQHEGWISFSSEPGKGTNFKIFLPVSVAPAALPKTELAVAHEHGGHEMIFVVEDETAVRQLMRSVLERYGYGVIEAESGAAALRIWEKRHHEIDLLLTDVVMPDGISGRELAERLHAEKPELKIVFTSGYSVEVAGHDFILRNGLNFLQKPYDPKKLAQTIREALNGVLR